MKLFIKNAILAAGLAAAMTSCNKDLKDDVTTTNDKLDAIQSSLDANENAYDFADGNALTLTASGYNKSNNEKFEKSFALDVARKSQNTMSVDHEVYENVYINSSTDNADFSFDTEEFQVYLYANKGDDNEQSAVNSYFTITISRVVNLEGISESDFKEWKENTTGVELSVGEAMVVDAELNLYELNEDGVNIWNSGYKSFDQAYEFSYGLEIDGFEYNAETRAISFKFDTENAVDFDEVFEDPGTFEISGEYAGNIYYIEDVALRTK